MATEYGRHRAPGRDPEDGAEEDTEPAGFEQEVTAKVVSKPDGSTPKTTRVAETK